MDNHNTPLIELVQTYVGQRLNAFDKELLETCHPTAKFVRHMDPIKNETARLVSSYGQLIIAVDADGSVESIFRGRTTGKQYRCVVRPLKKATTRRLVVVTNLDSTKRTQSGLWVWDFKG